jgi:hypothetical protein
MESISGIETTEVSVALFSAKPVIKKAENIMVINCFIL